MSGSKTRKRKKKKKGANAEISTDVSALSPAHPLERCVINSDWRDVHLANIIIVRKVGGGYTAAGFLVDTWGLGLKDAYLHKGLSRVALDHLLVRAAGAGELVACPLPLAQELVYGGLAWARQHGFRPPAEAIRYLKILPPPPGEPDISCFGSGDGEPVIIGDLREIMRRLP